MPNELLEAALQYAGRGWPIFRLSPGSKIPVKGSRSFRDATTDPELVARWWQETPNANVALATGQHLVLDPDGPGGLARLQALCDRHGPLPATLIAKTPRGWHIYFSVPAGTVIASHAEPREKGRDGLDWKCAGGYVVLPPSRVRGGTYIWATHHLPAEASSWLVAHCARAGSSVTPQIPHRALAERPAWLEAIGEITGHALTGIHDIPWSAHEEARLRSALEHVSPKGHDAKVFNGFALRQLNWDRSDGTSIGYDIWLDWISTDEGFANHDKAERKWATLDKYSANCRARTISSIFWEAQQNGWDGRAVTPEKLNGINGHHALFAPMDAGAEAIVFPDTDKAGNPRPTCVNTRRALQGLGVEARYDAFHEKILLNGAVLAEWSGEIKDHTDQMLCVAVHNRYGFDPGTKRAHDAAVQEALQHGFDPVLDYLDELHWDGRARLDTWLTTYMGADDTPLHREIGRLVLVAAVRRVREPGTKFDQIMVLEGPEGKGKSSAIEILAGKANFSDQTILHLDDKTQQESVQGIWLYEIADLAGMSRADIEKVKAFASRTVDRARPAYGRARMDKPRRCIFIATTNQDTYLQSHTGNRRFWPVKTSRIDLTGLWNDRDQLWAEAAAREAAGVTLALRETLWDTVGEIQDTRREHDPWDDILASVKVEPSLVGVKAEPGASATGQYEYRISSRDLLNTWLGLQSDRQNSIAAKRLAYSMRRLKWTGPMPLRINGTVAKGYFKPVTGD